MNGLVSFRLCTLSDEELLKKVDEGTDNIYKTGKIPSRYIPARPNDDYDLLVGELVQRYKDLLSQKSRYSLPWLIPGTPNFDRAKKEITMGETTVDKLLKTYSISVRVQKLLTQ